MVDLSLPVREGDFTSWRYTFSREGGVWIFETRYSFYEQRWYLDISDIQGVLQASRIKLVPGADLLDRWHHKDVPPGFLWVQGPNESRGAPALNGFDASQQWQMVYRTVLE